jgi:hypothetical protein
MIRNRTFVEALTWAAFALAVGMVIVVTIGTLKANAFSEDALEGRDPLVEIEEPPADGGGTPPGLYETDPGYEVPNGPSSTYPGLRIVPESKHPKTVPDWRWQRERDVRYELTHLWPPNDRFMWRSPPPATLPPTALTKRGFSFGPGR